MASEVTPLQSRAKALAAQFERGGVGHCIDEAIELGRQTLALCPVGHSERAISLKKLASYLSTRYGRLGVLEDLEEAVTLSRETLLLCPSGHPHRSSYLNNLGNSLSTRYQRLGALKDLDEAVMLGREALLLCPSGHPLRSSSLINLGGYFSSRHKRLGGIEDLDEAITICQEALLLCPSGHPHRSSPLNNLGSCLSTRYQRLGALKDLDEAVVLGREALIVCPSGHPNRSSSLINLGSYLSIRYCRLGRIEDLDEAVTLGRKALLLCPLGDPHRSSPLNNLGNCLSSRYQRLGALEDLDEAVTLGREALIVCPPGHPNRSCSLINLGNHLSSRYERLGVLEDLDEAVTLGREALLLCPLGHPHRSSPLNSLGNCLSARYQRLGALKDLDEAVMLGREALLLCPSGHPNRLSSLINFGGYLSIRYGRIGRTEDLDEVVMLGREALLLCPLEHPRRLSSLNDLGNHLASRYGQLSALKDLEEAITLGREALLLCPPGHSGRLRAVHALARRYRLRCSDAYYQEQMFSLYTELADVRQIVSLEDISDATDWIAATEDFNHPSIVLAYETILRLLVRHLTALPPLPHHLATGEKLASSLAVDAFSACLRNHSPMQGIELLDLGRGVSWGQLTRLNSLSDDITLSGSTGKALADNFTRVTSLIRDAINSPGPDQPSQVCSLTVELQGVIAKIRQLPSLPRFLLPPRFSDLQQAASAGPIIVVNASQYSCDALIVFVDRDPVHVPLITVTRKDLQDRSLRLRTLASLAKREDVTKELMTFLRALWNDVVSPIVDALRTIHPVEKRIWWCPTAEFTLLPLHAAGPFRKGQKNLPDLYISSYTSTLYTLIRARRHVGLAPRRKSTGIVVIGQANTSDQSVHHSADTELTNLDRILDGLVTFTRIEGPDSCISRAAEELGRNGWVHFACHGVPDRRLPFNSAFAFHDGQLTLERVVQCGFDNPEFAYFSACHTTVGDEESPGEVIQFPSALQFVGFRSVIGSMWAVDDGHANQIASTFYKHLIDDSGHLDYTRAAFALNRTMGELRDVPFDQRILYIHLGV